MLLGMRPEWLHYAVLAATSTVLTLYPGTSTSSAQESTPEFLEKGSLEISVSDFDDDADPPTIEIINPSSVAVTVSLYITGAPAESIKLEPSELTVRSSATSDVALVATGSPNPGQGEAVLVGGGRVDRRAIVITDSSSLPDQAWVRAVVGFLVLSTVTTLAVVLKTRGRRGHLQLVPSRAAESVDDLRSDRPSTQDLLNRQHFAHALATIAETATPPLVVGVLGEWGAGKSTVLKHISAELGSKREVAVVWFDPWLHHADDQPVLALLHNIVTQLGLEESAEFERRLEIISSTLGATAFRLLARTQLADIEKAIADYDKAHFRERTETTRLRTHFEHLIAAALSERGSRLLVVFIDDLDRCAPEQIIRLLDGLKLYMSLPSCLFYIALAPEVVRAGVANRYKDIGLEERAYLGLDERAYLDKVIQLPFDLPALSRTAIDGYFAALLPNGLEGVAHLLAETLPPNPRSIKRFVNILAVHHALALRHDGLKGEYEPAVLAALLVLQTHAPKVYVSLGADGTLLQTIADDIDPSTTRESDHRIDEAALRSLPSSADDHWGPS